MHIVFILTFLFLLWYFFIKPKEQVEIGSHDREALAELGLQPFDPASVDLSNGQAAVASISGYPDLSVESIIRVLHKHWGVLGEFKDLGGSGNIRRIGFKEIIFEYELYGPVLDIEDLCIIEFERDRLPLINHTIQHHDATIIIRVLADIDNVTAMLFLAMAAAAVSESCKQVREVWWVSANHMVSRKSMLKNILGKSFDNMKIDFLVSANTYVDNKGSINGFTCGLRAFGLDEFEVIESPESEKELHHRLKGLAIYSITNCSKILNGDTTGYDKYERIKLKKEPSQTVYKGWVFRLYYQ